MFFARKLFEIVFINLKLLDCVPLVKLESLKFSIATCFLTCKFALFNLQANVFVVRFD